jgi:DNA-binding MarR family transcriptional regulator
LNETLGGYLERWHTAMQWRRQADKELEPLGLTLMGWLVLDATVALIRKHEDAVSQKLVCDRTHLDKAQVSRLMQSLEQKGYVDRAPEFGGPANRVWVTERGMVAAARCRAQLAARCLEEAKVRQCSAARQPARGP